MEFPCLETLPSTVALGPKTALLTLVCTTTERSAVDHQPIGAVPDGEPAPQPIGTIPNGEPAPQLIGIAPNDESAPFLGMPSAHGGHEKAGKGEGFKESLCCQKLQLQMFGKTFFKGLIIRIDNFIIVTERGDIAEEKVFPEQSVFQVAFVCCREASKTLSQTPEPTQQILA